jgi:hypothetical protein
MSRSINNFINPVTGLNVASGGGLKNNLSAIVAPTASDDDARGYSVGSIWVDVLLNSAYICTSNAIGAASWNQMGAGGGAGAPGGANGAVQFNSAGGFGGDAPALFWDASNDRLGIGTNTPSVPLTVNGATTITGTIVQGSSGNWRQRIVSNVMTFEYFDGVDWIVRYTIE